MRCLVEAIKRVDQEKQATPKRELVMIFQVVFFTIVHLIISGFNSYTTPQPQNGDAPLVAIGGYNDALSVGIDLCRHLTAAAKSGVGIGL